jgi:hypothetical protein
MARQRPSVTVRALTEQAVRHFPIYGRAAQNRLQRAVRDAARRAAEAEPERFRYERSTGVTEERVAVLRSPETFDRRGRTQGYQHCPLVSGVMTPGVWFWADGNGSAAG